jgi:hypothetical protein
VENRANVLTGPQGRQLAAARSAYLAAEYRLTKDIDPTRGNSAELRHEATQVVGQSISTRQRGHWQGTEAARNCNEFADQPQGLQVQNVSRLPDVRPRLNKRGHCPKRAILATRGR